LFVEEMKSYNYNWGEVGSVPPRGGEREGEGRNIDITMMVITW
jgi:hypothetical protein